LNEKQHAYTPVPPPHMEGITSRQLSCLDERERERERDATKCNMLLVRLFDSSSLETHRIKNADISTVEGRRVIFV